MEEISTNVCSNTQHAQDCFFGETTAEKKLNLNLIN